MTPGTQTAKPPAALSRASPAPEKEDPPGNETIGLSRELAAFAGIERFDN